MYVLKSQIGERVAQVLRDECNTLMSRQDKGGDDWY